MPHRGTIERRHQQREAILRATSRLAGERGWQQVTMRRLAAALGWKAASLYEYFSSKEELLAALVGDGFARLLARVAGDGEKPGLHELARRTWAFAWEEPQTYQAMHGLAGVPFGPPEQPEAKALFAIVREAVQREVGDAQLDLDAAADVCWALLHGTIALAMSGRIAGGRARAARLLDVGLDALVTGWRGAGGDGQRPGPAAHDRPGRDPLPR
ncbi:MAG TPA: TetR/AcrR family transcriptional regulator [Candidatus Dormibacteraeota bacterium]|nr:TetR/AcrR family transcriptional regulator [Candidatus Dormibacteraeota bacterium]